MDRAKRERAAERSDILEIVKSLEDELDKDPVNQEEVVTSLQLLETSMQTLSDLDEKIKEFILDTEDVDGGVLSSERTESREFRKKATLVKVKAETKLQNLWKSQRPVSPTRSESSNAYSRRVKLPKIDLMKFNGDLTDWLGWWAQFKKIDEDEELHNSDKFSYLVQSMVLGSRAEEVVKRYPQSSENYPKALAALKERFGKEKLLKQVYVRELIKLILDNRSKEKTSLATLFDKLEASLRSLESLGVSMEQMVEFLFPMVESSLPEDVLLAWQRSPNFGKDGSRENPPKSELDFLMAFLKIEIENEEQRKLARSGFGLIPEKRKNQNRPQHADEDVPTSAGLFSGTSGGGKAGKVSCIFCEKPHDSNNCYKAQKMKLEEKKEIASKKRACFSCLKIGHVVSKCPIRVKCLICGKRHAILLCPGPEAKPKVATEEQTVLSSLNCTSEVLLRTLIVRLENPVTHQTRNVRMILDCGSQKSYILKKTAEALNLDVKETVTMNHLLFGGNEVVGNRHSIFEVNIGSPLSKFSSLFTLMDQEYICGEVPRIPDGPWIQQFKKRGVRLSDVDPKNPMEVEVLLGADVMGKILTGRIQRLASGLTATETKFGWAVFGPMCGTKLDTVAMTVLSMTISSFSVSQLWNLDTIGILDPVEVKSKEEKEREAIDHFQRTVKQDSDGRYSVSLPWSNGVQSLPSNRLVAQKRLENTTKKLVTLGRFGDYDKVFSDWEEEGIISVVKSESETANCHFLPHRAVFKSSVTTPVRPVFDASCKVGRNPSLNDCLEKGPNLIELIPSVLLRFRFGRIGVTADIRKAFLMIDVNESDRKYLQFLWWEDSSQSQVKVFQHNRVVFGMNCSPFLLGAVILHHLAKNRSVAPTVVSLVEKSLYVDNLVFAVDGESDLGTIREVSTSIMSTAKMELRQWEQSGICGEQFVTSVLGLKWNKKTDTLFCDSVPFEIPLKITKRVILSVFQKVFDPLGFLAPVLIVPKMLLQKAWSDSKKWDEEVTEEIKAEFLSWSKELSSVMEKIQIPRDMTGNVGQDCQCQLHVFGDASQKAYAAVAFLRVETTSDVKVYLVQCKSRVAPLKATTIPRLELLASTIAARLGVSVKEALHLSDVTTYYWSDSSTALSWIRGSDNWGTFVGNRVKEICSLTNVSDWNHIPGVNNPADVPSRGISPIKFHETKWWEGPAWLRLPKEQWPNAEFVVDEAEVNRERKKNISSLVNLNAASELWYIRKNHYESNLRVICFVLRFVSKLKKMSVEKSPRPTGEELETTEKMLIKFVQSEAFDTTKSVIEGLRVVRDEEGIVRVSTKIVRREDTASFRFPALLPHSHPLVDLIIQKEHLQNVHGGAQLMMSKLREKFWIVRGRQAVVKVIRQCVKCKRFDGRKYQVKQCPLPEPRVREASAFQVTGIDLAGPVSLKNKKKAYIVLFTCAVYRGVHLEVTESLSTEDFLLCFVRFCKRKQRPSIVYSDNGTNFVGAVNLFKKIDWEEVKKETQQQRINWIFNPPSAPWWGGWWERLVRSTKDLLRKSLGFGKLSLGQLETALCEVEAAINHRPLTYVTEDPEDFVPLTPAMFMHNLPYSEVPESSAVIVPTLKKEQKNLQQLHQEIRDRFRSEYLGQLIQRGKEQKIRKFEIGEVVLVEVDNQKRIFWPMAKIVELLPGKDGEVRVARIRTKNGTQLRPIQRLIPLEIRHDVTEIVTEEEPKSGVKKSITKPRKLQEQESSVEELDMEVESDPVVTRSGRQVRKPKRFTFS